MSITVVPTGSRQRLASVFRMGVGKLMLLTGASTILFWAWLYNREYRDADRALTSNYIHALESEDPKVRLSAAQDLGQVSELDLARTVPALAGAMRDDDRRVRRAATVSISYAIGRCANALNGQVTPELELATGALIFALRDRNAEVRAEAAWGFERLQIRLYRGVVLTRGSTPPQIGSDPSRALPALVKAMHDPEPNVRERAASSYALLAFVNQQEPGPLLVLIADDPSSAVRTNAIESFVRIWHEQWDCYPLVLRELNASKVVAERQQFAFWIGWDNTIPVPTVLPALREALAIDDPIVQLHIPMAVGRMGSLAKPALPALLSIAKKQFNEDLFQYSASRAIVAIDPDSPETRALLPILTERLIAPKSRNNFDESMNILCFLGKSAAPAVPSLRKALERPDPLVRQGAAIILGTIGPDAKEAVADLDAMALYDPDRAVKAEAENALSLINKQ